MKIEVWSDYVCPFCYVGKRRMEEALESTGLKDKAEIVFKAFELDPNSPKISSESTYKSLARKYVISVDEAKKMTENVVIQAKEVGLDFSYDNSTPANTFDAHRLAKLAEQEGVAAELTERLLKAYFVDNEKIGSKDVLLRIAEEAGILSERANEVLDSEEFAEDIKADITEAGQIGVQGVPFFVINRKYAISGAQPAKAFEDTFKKVLEESGE